MPSSEDASGVAQAESISLTRADHNSPVQAPPLDKRKPPTDRNDVSPLPPSVSKKPRPSSSGESRKEREEWTDAAIGVLLDAYSDKYLKLNGGSLRGKDWDDVTAVVNEKGDLEKSVDQCKNKVDNLKKRYKGECHRLSSGGQAVSNWHWFKKLEGIVRSSPCSPKTVAEEDLSVEQRRAAALMRQRKRFSVASPDPVSTPNDFKMKSLPNPRWKRVVLKISGAAFAGAGPQNVDPKTVMLIATEIARASSVGVEVAVEVGCRNFFCGDTWVNATGADRTTVFQIGMMASTMNSILLQTTLEKLGVQACVQTGFTMQQIAEPYIRRRAIRHLEKGRVVIFGGIGAGVGSSLFTTDATAAIRASEIHANALVKGTNANASVVPNFHSRNGTAAFEHISFRELISRGYNGMDMTAITFCEENNLPVLLFNLFEPGNISKALCGDQVGTLIDQSGSVSCEGVGRC